MLPGMDRACCPLRDGPRPSILALDLSPATRARRAPGRRLKSPPAETDEHPPFSDGILTLLLGHKIPVTSDGL